MIDKVPESFSTLFHICCLATTIGFVGWCIKEYSLDHDYTETTFARFHETSDDIYPSVTICDMDPIMEEKYDDKFRKIPVIKKVYKKHADVKHEDCLAFDSNVVANYKEFLNGRKYSVIANDNSDWLRRLREVNVTHDQWLNSLQSIDYDEITTGLDDLLTDFYITFPIEGDNEILNYHTKNGSLDAIESQLGIFANTTRLDEISIHELKHVKSYVSFRGAYRKCITIDIPTVKTVNMREIGMKLNISSLKGSKISSGKFFFFLTYPKQYLRTKLGSGIKLEMDNPVDCYKFEVHVGYMRVVRRRDKKQKPCNSDWRRHDEKAMSHSAQKVGCIPRHWKMPSNLPYCLTPQQHDEINKEIDDENGFMPPCRSIETLLKTTKGKTNWRMCFGNHFFEFKLFVDEQSHYEEVFLYPSYPLQTLVGNSGGYIGLFVGYTVAQLPELLNWVIKRGKRPANFFFGKNI